MSSYPHNRLCKLKTCSKPLRARGYCITHYTTYMRGTLNSPLTTGEQISLAKQRKKRERRARSISAGLPKGEEHWNWKGGISAERKVAYATTEYNSWRDTVFQRDNYTCQVCDQYGDKLHVDHMKSWKDYPKLRYELSNGRTLCIPCHYYVTFKRKMPVGSRWGARVRARA